VPDPVNGWNQWSKFVLKALEDIAQSQVESKVERKELENLVRDLRSDFEDFRLKQEVDIAIIKEQAKVHGRIWGVISGLATGGIALLVLLARNFL
jgi:hypothetical protein